MAAPKGNQFAVGHGRPRRLDVELGRLEQAAEHARGCLQSDHLIVLLAPGAEHAGEVERRIAEATAALVEIERRLEPLRWLAAEIAETAEQRRAREQSEHVQKALGREATDDEVALIRGTARGVRLHHNPATATTACALDRACAEEHRQ